MADKQNIVEEARTYIQSYLLENLPGQFLFHNYKFTTYVASASEKLAKKANLPPKQKEILLLASLFHTSGYVEGVEKHEGRSAQKAVEFLESKKVKGEIISSVEALILDTPPQDDDSLILLNLFHDARWSFLGRKSFFEKGTLLRLENEYVRGEKYSLREWNKKLLNLQISTKFKTNWANELYANRKNKNIIKQKQELREAKKKTIRRRTGKDFGRGIDTVYRVTLKNHIELSNIADGKANMIISINTLIVSIIITAITTGISIGTSPFKGNLSLYIPVILLLLSSLLAIIFAVFSAIPKVSGGGTKSEEGNLNRNMLFFGNFLNLEEAAFVQYLKGLKKDQEKLYDDLSRDLFNLGKVLQRKYYLLTIAYRVFVSGLALSLFVFLFIYLIYPSYL